jgi:non-ribosomal peptide synthetase-like protein
MRNASPATGMKLSAGSRLVKRQLPAVEPLLLHEYFERQVVLRPDHPAIECGGQSMTYAQLNEEARRVANMLRNRGVRPGSLVAIYSAKSCRMFAALIGILKAGAAYVPIDPKNPVERVQRIIEDAAVSIVLSDGPRREALAPHVAAEIIDLGSNGESDALSLAAAEPDVVTPKDLCYVIYTSGSTGTPKGVLIEHRNAVNFVRAMNKVYGLNEKDRIYQGFSIAFDASVEEIWAAFSLGGTLVVPDQETSRSSLDAADFITSQRITCFSTVPSFLALMKPDLPTVRLLILGGEVCPPDLVNRWSRPGLRMLNTYGPTEATVVATAAECLPGEPVTIGTALPGYETFVLDDNQVPVKVGECGELYLGGESVARGYMNRPELTSERFVASPFARQGDAPRSLYRTQDLVRLTENGRLQFLGRSDGQVKIRGFRVELSEIEAVLMEHPSIQLAATKVVETGGLMDIAAYVVLAGEPADFEREAIGELLRGRMPEYMVPKYLDVVEELPTATSGKFDRKMLPPPRDLLGELKRTIVAPTTALERAIAKEWEQVLGIDPISIQDDFFLDVHGHSLAAAKIVTELRAKLGTVRVSVRDLYEHRTIQELSLYLESQGVEVAAENVGDATLDIVSIAPALPPLPRARWIYVALQLLGLAAFYGVSSAPLVFAVVMVSKILSGDIEWDLAAKITTVVGFAVWPSWLLLSVALKWLVIGRYKPGRYPVWGFYYFRWWLVSRFQTLSWSQMFVGTPLMSLYFRLMGAKVGKNCMIGTPICTAFDLIEIGDNTSIGNDTHILGYRVEDGWLILGNVNIGSDCFVGTHCCFGLNVEMRDRSRLDDMSLLADNAVISEGDGMRGSPATKAAVFVPPSSGKRPRRGANFAFGLIHLALIYAMGYILIFSAAPAVALIGYALYVSGPAAGIAVAFASVPISILWYLQLVILVKRLAIGRIFPGTYSIHSAAYLRYWFASYLLTNTRHILLPLYATVFMPRVLRQLGAKVGRMVEISTIMHAMPDLLELEDGSFLADACIVGGLRVHQGVIEIRSNKIGKRTFVGNSALVPAGVDLGDNGLVGVMSTPPAGVGRTPDGTQWFGSPGFELPGIQKTSCFTAQRTFDPSYLLIVMRGLVEVIRVLLPGMLLMATAVLFCTAIVFLYGALPLPQVLLLVPAIAMALSFGSLICVAFLKTMLMGRFAPTLKPLWSGYVWLNDVVNGVYETIADATLTPLLGTLFAPAFLRMMGCDIGRWVFLETTLFSEFDLVRIGDRAALNVGSTIQPHLFEDRIMKSDSIVVGDGCSVGNMAVVLYTTEMQNGSSLGPLSVLMKGEGLPASSRWYGIPTQPASWPGKQSNMQGPAEHTNIAPALNSIDLPTDNIPHAELFESVA